MRVAVDLHIHSALSPCSDDEMTPNNIVNMALIKELDFIAVTDHNSAENVEAAVRCAAGKDIIVVPGMELETCEEVHLVCLFPSVETAWEMQQAVYNALPDRKNREDIFGRQLMMNAQDEVVGHLDKLLLVATALSVDEVFEMAARMGAVVIPAHVDRDSFSMLSNLGSVPEYLPIRYLEISRQAEGNGFKQNNPLVSGYDFLRSSDAHHLGDILERESFLELEEKSLACLLSTLRGRS